MKKSVSGVPKKYSTPKIKKKVVRPNVQIT